MDDLIRAARPAAEWWAARLRAAHPEVDGLHPNLTPRQALVATAEIGLRGAQLRGATPNEATIEMFTAELAQRIAATKKAKVTLRVDYHPEDLLGQAADAAGLSDEAFPRKTTMQVRSDHVLGKAGYRATWAVVWSAPEWTHPACGVQDWPDDANGPIGPECPRPRWHDGAHDWTRSTHG